ncbi:methyltransferase domain-containing protein [Chlorogloeopsis fritschii PCC 9212]|uniref:Methyltransferase type 11 domain-containing protein n=1 Tax=Chlorogloeopsis fritschii PCC 6912 TaxID=211165 RepID=A0A433NKI4_CHLFR|nr:class I SAM-dependent methyltransferase [Chlorogloeopsis fritschii]RUR83321.1 hypothetical protein PCC6912_21540 [Chlorogloeopsis fritschii PCC 6912]
MEINELQKHWNEFGKQDPLWSILSDPAKKGNKWELEEFFKSGEEEIEGVLKYLKQLGVSYSRKRALDFGCGVGRLTQALCRYFDECVGVDIAPSMIALANKYNRYQQKCKYYVNDSDNLRTYDDNYFDFIYSRIVLQHIMPEYSMNYLKEFVRILAPNGLLVFQIPSELAPIENLESLEDAAYRAEITLQEPLNIVKPGSTTTIKVKVKNLSNVTWKSSGESNEKHYINLGNHWLNESGEIVVNDDGREPLLKSLQPLEEVEFMLAISTPKEAGNYILELDMVHEGVAWFKDKGSKTIKIPVKVEEVNQGKDIGNIILNFYRKLTNPKQERANNQHFVPRMEMHCVPKEVVLQLINDCGGKVVDIQQDFSSGKWWISYLYAVTK